MGRARLSFRDLIKEGEENTDLFFDLKYKAEIVGKINVVTTWHPEEEVKTAEKMPSIPEKIGMPDDEQGPVSTRLATENDQTESEMPDAPLTDAP